MVDEDEHNACVRAWMERTADGLPPERVIEAFAAGFAVLWRRTVRTLGDVTLAAIVERVLYNAAERFPFLSVLELDAAGICWQKLRENAGGVSLQGLAEGLRFVMVEFLTVLGNLTADILTPALHAELSSFVPADSDPDEERRRDEAAARDSKDVEGEKP